MSCNVNVSVEEQNGVSVNVGKTSSQVKVQDNVQTVNVSEQATIKVSTCDDGVVNVDVGVPGPAGRDGVDGLDGDFEDAVNPQINHITITSLAPGASSDADSSQIASGKTGYLMKLLASSSIPFKLELKTVTNGVENPIHSVFYGAADRMVDFRTPTKTFIVASYNIGAGFDGFRATITNLDAGPNASNVYVSFYFDEV